MAMDAGAMIRWEGYERFRELLVEAGQRGLLGRVEVKDGLDAFQRCGIQMTGVGLGDDPVDEIVNFALYKETPVPFQKLALSGPPIRPMSNGSQMPRRLAALKTRGAFEGPSRAGCSPSPGGFFYPGPGLVEMIV